MVGTFKKKFSAVMFVTTSLSGCGPASVSNSLDTRCSGVRSQTGNQGSQLRLTSTNSVSTTATAGLGYLDIHSTDVNGQPVSRRCTVSIFPRDLGITEVDVFTSGHCFFEPDTEEFKNSKFTLQVAHNGGYFPVDARMPIQEVFGAFARNLSGVIEMVPEKLQERLNEAIRTEMISACETGTQAFAEQLAQQRKTIACFGKNESRSVHLVLEPKDGASNWLGVVLSKARENVSNAYRMLPDREQKVMKLRLESKRYEKTLELNLKHFAYLLNETHCSPENDQKGMESQTKKLCAVRTSILPMLPSILKEKYEIIRPIVEVKNQTLADLKEMNSDIFACRFSTLTDLDVEKISSLKNACEVEKLSRLIWDQWVAPGPENLANLLQLSSQKMSDFGGALLSVKSNALDSQASVLAENVGQSRPGHFEISSDTGQLSSSSLNTQAIMFNFDPQINKMFLMKKDSGSTFNLLNVFPLATLTTLDGEPTSGGTSVLPLPPVSDDPDEFNCK